jgi:hypothetical protein
MSIENHSWNMEKLYSTQSFIGKPKITRDMKWTLQPEKENRPSFKKYILFLLENRNSVFPVSLGTIIKNSQEYYTVIDGNNRINSIITFMRSPYKIFPEYYENVLKSIKESELTENEKNECIRQIIDADYKLISSFRRLNDILKINFNIKNDLFVGIENELIKVQDKFLFTGNLPFDLNIHISINIFKNGTIAQYNNTYDDINRYVNPLSINELLASSLYNTIVNLEDETIKYNIKNEIKDFYNNRGKNEVLEQFKIDDVNVIELNAFDFMVGLQNYISKKYNVIPEFKTDGLSEFFKLFEYLYGSYDSENFTNANISDFINKIDFCCNVLNKAFNSIFPPNINESIFNKKAQKCKGFIKRNQMLLILVSNIANMNKMNTKKLISLNMLALIYHELCYKKNVENIEEEHFNMLKMDDCLEYHGGGKYIDNICYSILNKEHDKIFKIDKNKFIEILKINVESSKKESRHDVLRKKNKRRQLGLIYKILLANYWKRNIPNKFLDKEYSKDV